MIEAVGHQYLDVFFRCCSNLLKDTGMMLIQAITMADHAFDRHKREVDFIKRYIFPGSCIPSVSAIGKSIASATDLRLSHLEELTHYARTLETWRRNFFSSIDRVRALGYWKPSSGCGNSISPIARQGSGTIPWRCANALHQAPVAVRSFPAQDAMPAEKQ